MPDSLHPCGVQPTRLPCPWEFSRQEYWSRLPCPLPGDLPNPGIEPKSPALQEDSSPMETLGKPKFIYSGTERERESVCVCVRVCVCVCVCVRARAQSCPTLCNPMDCSLPGSSDQGIFRASILEWVAISYARGYFLWHLLHWQVDSLPVTPPGKPL